ncbi:hypothetical protein [Streptomyces sp. NPDC093261]|uniref:hypothetical protein n=1 Tax=Streptomyces sp. NPDC093261 TaxID=3366037 RepID=UPI0038228104
MTAGQTSGSAPGIAAVVGHLSAQTSIVREGPNPDFCLKKHGWQVISLGEFPVADEDGCERGEGQKVVGLALF